MNPLSFILLHMVFLTAAIAPQMHGEGEHTVHEDCAVPHASPIQHPGVNVVCVCTHNDISECPLYGECHVCMAVEGVEVVFVVADSGIKLGESSELVW